MDSIELNPSSPIHFQKIICNLLLNIHPICVNRWSHPLSIIDTFKFYLNYHTVYLEYNNTIADNTVGDLNDTLKYASEYGNIIIVKWCLKNNANHKKALLFAALKDHLKIVKLLLAVGADVHAENDYALQYAVKNGNLEIVQLLLANGANIHAQDDNALQNAAYGNYTEIIKTFNI